MEKKSIKIILMKNIIIILSIFFSHSIANAQIASLNIIGQTPGGAGYHVNWIESSKKLIVGCGTSLWLYDMLLPDSPKIIGKRPLQGLINETVLYNYNVLFIAASFDGVYAIDISSDSLNILDHKYIDSPTLKRSAYDLALIGDTLLIPCDGRIVRLKYDRVNGFQFIDEVGPLLGAFCVATKNNLVAVGQLGIGSGKILLYDKNNLNSPIVTWTNNNIASVVKIKFADLSDSIIYICGSSPNTGLTSYFYALKYNGTNIIALDSFDIKGIPILAAANIQNIDSRNDTIYLATGCAVETSKGSPLSYIPVLDASGLPNAPMKMIQYYNAGLWHFDVALMKGTPYMATASEWLGIAINDISSSNPLDTLMFLRTGGWTQKAKTRGDTLWVANEGWGLSAYLIDSLLFKNGYTTKSQILHIYNQNAHFFVSDFDFVNDTLIFLSSGHLFNIKPFLQGGQPDSINKINMSWVVSVNKVQTNLGVRLIIGSEIPFLNYGSLSIIDPFNKKDSMLFTTMVYNNPQCLTVKDNLVFYGAKQDSNSVLYLIASKVENDSLIQIASIPLPQDFQGINSISIEDDLVAISRGNSIHFFKWDGLNFTHLSEYDNITMFAVSIQLKDNFLYVADKKDGLIIFDVSNPSSPQIIAKFDGRGRWKNLFGFNNVTLGNDGKIFLSDFNAGVIIIEPFKPSFIEQNDFLNMSDSIITIYPNPSNGLFNIKFNSEEFSYPIFISIFDINGTLIKRISQNSYETHLQSISLDLSDFADGSYLILLATNEFRRMYKLIKK